MLKVLCADYWEMELCSKTLCADYAHLFVYYVRHYAQHYARAAFVCATLCAVCTEYARLCFIMRRVMRNIMCGQLTLCAKCSAPPGCLRRLPLACPTTPPVHTHHGTAEPANATNISCHSQVEARIISRIISRIIRLDMGPIQRLSSFQREPMCNRWHLGSHC